MTNNVWVLYALAALAVLSISVGSAWYQLHRASQYTGSAPMGHAFAAQFVFFSLLPSTFLWVAWGITGLAMWFNG